VAWRAGACLVPSGLLVAACALLAGDPEAKVNLALAAAALLGAGLPALICAPLLARVALLERRVAELERARE
jgi:hypothetical protein